MMMPDDLNAIGRSSCTMTVVKMKMLRVPRIEELDHVVEITIMIAGDQNQLAKSAQLFD